MIDYKDVRIGNNVRTLNRWKKWQSERIESMDDGGINLSACYDGGIDREYEWDQLEPIPLTEELLIAAGFWKHDEHSKTWLLTLSKEDEYPTTLQIWLREEENYIQICRSGIAAWTINHFESLHQLQNLYYALTDKELDIKL